MFYRFRPSTLLPPLAVLVPRLERRHASVASAGPRPRGPSIAPAREGACAFENTNKRVQMRAAASRARLFLPRRARDTALACARMPAGGARSSRESSTAGGTRRRRSDLGAGRAEREAGRREALHLESIELAAVEKTWKRSSCSRLF